MSKGSLLQFSLHSPSWKVLAFPWLVLGLSWVAETAVNIADDEEDSDDNEDSDGEQEIDE